MKKIFVTGGTGFLGKEIVKKLAQIKDYKLTVLTRRNIVSSNKNIQFVDGDILDKKSFEKYIVESDIILHIAGIGSGSRNMIWKTNVDGTKNVLDLSSGKKFILISSETVLYKNQGVYGESKNACEELVKKSNNHLILRVTVAYGKHDNSRLGRIIGLCKRYPLVIIPGNGKNLMQPIYIEDVATFILSAIKKDKNGIFILAGKSEISMNEFVEHVGDILDKKIIKIHIPLFLVYPLVKINEIFLTNPVVRWSQIRNLNTNRVYNIEDTIKELNHSPLTVHEGLLKTLRD